MSTISVRALWPYMRVVPDCADEFELLRRHGFDVAILAEPDARMPTLLCRELLLRWLEKTGDAALGLHAADHIQSADFGVVHHIVRNCRDLRAALTCLTRYTRLIDDNLRVELIEEEERFVWRIQNYIPRPSPVNEFQVALALKTFRSCVDRPVVPLEVHVCHKDASDPREYQRVFSAPVRLGREDNALVLDRALLDAPIAHANVGLFAAFEKQAVRELQRLDEADSVVGKVRRLLLERLDAGDIQITDTARKLHMSTATLRRRLADEGTTHKALLDEIRRDVALSHVHERRFSIGEIAYMLGFSSQSAFGKAFRRWVGASPLEYREQLRGSERVSAVLGK